MLLTERTAHLHDHAGQISFPGGRVEENDADAIATALREAHEEIGLPPANVDVIGALPEYLTATGYKVTPVIGLIERAVFTRARCVRGLGSIRSPARVPDGPDQS